MKITQITANFNQYPVADPESLGLAPDSPEPQELTIGDLSGNLVMLMWILMTAGLAHMSKESYLDLVMLQEEINSGHKNSFNPKPVGKNTFIIDTQKVKGLTSTQRDRFQNILNNITFKPNSNLLFRLLGDELTDRLGDDSEMIETLNQMAEENLAYRILGSNHLHMLVQNFLSADGYDQDDLIPNGQGVSLLHMLKSIQEGVINENDIRQKIANVYLPRLKLIDYSRGNTDTTISLYAHAPFSPHRLIEAAKYFEMEIPEKFSNTDQVISFIDEINAKFQQTYVAVYFSYNQDQAKPDLDDQTAACAFANSEIGALFWMKDHSEIAKDPMPACFEDINFDYLIHGHTHGALSLNSDYSQDQTCYVFSVAVATPMPENTLRDTASPVTFISENERKPGYLPRYLTRGNAESGNNSPATSTTPIHFDKK